MNNRFSVFVFTLRAKWCGRGSRSPNFGEGWNIGIENALYSIEWTMEAHVGFTAFRDPIDIRVRLYAPVRKKFWVREVLQIQE